MMATFSRRCVTRLFIATPRLLYSASVPPMDTPSVSRPPERWSSDDAAFASSTGFRYAVSITAVPSRTRVVCAATHVSIVSGSRMSTR